MESRRISWIGRSALLCVVIGVCIAQFPQRQQSAFGQYNQYNQYNQYQQQQQQPLHQQQQRRAQPARTYYNEQQQDVTYDRFAQPQQRPRTLNAGVNSATGSFASNSASGSFGSNSASGNFGGNTVSRSFSGNSAAGGVASNSLAGSGGSCPERNGRFPVANQCDAYIECIDGVPEQKLCPEGLLFNPEARFNYPCGYPIDVQCLGRSNLQPAQPTEECPHQFGYFKVGDRQNCGKFMNCVDGRAFTFDCPEGLAYNPETYRCDWPDQVADCDAEAFLGFTCPKTNENGFLISETKFYRSPTDCQRYYVCVENRPRLQNCGEGHAFNELIGTCDAAENVTGCEPPAITKPVSPQSIVNLPVLRLNRRHKEVQF